MPTPVTKDIFLNARTCSMLGWLLRNDQCEAGPTEADLFRMEQGKEIGKLARTLFPQGQFVSGRTNAAAAQKTLALMKDGSVTTLFEATFMVGNYVTKPDVLLREADGWRIIEVKSSLSDSGQLDALIDDLTYTAMVLRRAGVKINACELMLLSREYRKGQDPSKLFERLDQTREVSVRLASFEAAWDQIDASTSGTQPEPKLLPACRGCEHFESKCMGKGVEHSIFCLPRLRAEHIERLSKSGVVSVLDLPGDLPLSGLQQRVVRCTREQKPFVSPSLAKQLRQIKWPAYYLDFETVMTALPLYADMPPYRQVTTQYSLHRVEKPGADFEHFEFLADAERDCEEKLAESLLADLGIKGSIFVYSSFEKTRLNALAERFPRLAKPLGGVIERLYDLLSVIRDGYYHPDFGGSFSIKVVLPTLVPELSYKTLAIGNGDAAVAHFARMALGRYSSKEKEQVRSNLLAYCKQDTLAMVKLHNVLLQMAS